MARPAKWSFLVQYMDSIGPVWLWIEAESADQITSVYDDVMIPDPPGVGNPRANVGIWDIHHR